MKAFQASSRRVQKERPQTSHSHFRRGLMKAIRRSMVERRIRETAAARHTGHFGAGAGLGTSSVLGLVADTRPLSPLPSGTYDSIREWDRMLTDRCIASPRSSLPPLGWRRAASAGEVRNFGAGISGLVCHRRKAVYRGDHGSVRRQPTRKRAAIHFVI